VAIRAAPAPARCLTWINSAKNPAVIYFLREAWKVTSGTRSGVTPVSFNHSRYALTSNQSARKDRPMYRRRNRRVAAFLTVRIWGVDAKSLPFTQHAQVRNISDGGAVLQGMIRPVKAGAILHVQHEADQAQFRVVWVGKQGTQRQGEIGIERLLSEPSIWDVNLLHCCQLVGKG